MHAKATQHRPNGADRTHHITTSLKSSQTLLSFLLILSLLSINKEPKNPKRKTQPLWCMHVAPGMPQNAKIHSILIKLRAEI